MKPRNALRPRSLSFFVLAACAGAGTLACSIDPLDSLTHGYGWGGDGPSAEDGSAVDVQACHAAGESCTTYEDCCGAACVLGSCASVACAPSGGACQADGDCCGNDCVGGACRPPACRTAGAACTGFTQCCSKVCAAGMCTPPAPPALVDAAGATDASGTGPSDAGTSVDTSTGPEAAADVASGGDDDVVTPPLDSGGTDDGGGRGGGTDSAPTDEAGGGVDASTAPEAGSSCKASGVSCLDNSECCSAACDYYAQTCW